MTILQSALGADFPGAHGATVTMSLIEILQSILYCGRILFTSPILRANRNLAHVYSHRIPFTSTFVLREFN